MKQRTESRGTLPKIIVLTESDNYNAYSVIRLSRTVCVILVDLSIVMLFFDFSFKYLCWADPGGDKIDNEHLFGGHF